MNTTTIDEKVAMSVDAVIGLVDLDALPGHVRAALAVRASLETAAKAAEETWQAWAENKQNLQRITRVLAGQGRDQDAMARRKEARDKEATSHSVYTRWQAQVDAFASTWDTIRDTLTRRECLWIYMLTTPNVYTRVGYRASIVTIDTRERIAQVNDRIFAHHAAMWVEHTRYGKAWRANVGGTTHTFYTRDEAEAWACEARILVTQSNNHDTWIVFDFAG